MRFQQKATRVFARADAIITLGGGVDYDGRPTATTARRLDIALDLYASGLASALVMSGRWAHRIQHEPPVTEAEAMKRYALARGIGERAILLDTCATDTIGNAYYTKTHILEPLDMQHLIVVTSEHHVRRARMVFEYMLGPGYSIDFAATAEPGLRTGHDQAELAARLELERVLDGIAPGDHEAIRTRVGYLVAA